MIKIAIVGSRGFTKLHLVEEYIAHLDKNNTLIISGWDGVSRSNTVDKRATVVAFKYNIPVLNFPPEIGPDGRWISRYAGLARNTDIVNAADMVVAFWDGKSRGTRDTLTKAHKLGLRIQIYYDDGRIYPSWHGQPPLFKE